MACYKHYSKFLPSVCIKHEVESATDTTVTFLETSRVVVPKSALQLDLDDIDNQKIALQNPDNTAAIAILETAKTDYVKILE